MGWVALGDFSPTASQSSLQELDNLISYTPALVALLCLLACSAFFSCSEAAFFSLSQTEQRALTQKGTLGKTALHLLENPERLLNSILFGNLFVDLVFFTISIIITFQLGNHAGIAFGIAVGSLVITIFFGDVLPKNIGILAPQFFVLLTCIPLAFVVRILQPVLPLLSLVNLFSRRLFCPDFTPESYLRVSDLERAVAQSGNDADLLKREQRVLQNIVLLSDMKAAELMCPRSLLKTFRPPISFEQILIELKGTLPRSGYCLLTEPDSDEIVSSLCLTRLTATNLETVWEEQFEDVIYVPWSASVAAVFDRLQQMHRKIAVVVNEFGETVGIITIDDIVAVLFIKEHGRSQRLLNLRELHRIGDNRWQLNGLTSLRTLERKFGVSFRQFSSMTVGGLLQEILERFPHTGDECQIETLQFHVIDIENGYDSTVHLTCEATES